jgi:hypothetical protein
MAADVAGDASEDPVGRRLNQEIEALRAKSK